MTQPPRHRTPTPPTPPDKRPGPGPDATPATRPTWLQLALFVPGFAALSWAWSRAAGTPLEALLIADATVAPAARWIGWLTPAAGAAAQGFSIRAPGGGINVLNGCEGLDMLFLLWSALVAVPMGWRRRLVGLLGGTALVWLLNQLRVVALFYANRHDKDLFALLHGTVAPLLLVLCLTLAFVALLSWRAAPAGAAARPAS